MDLAPLTDASNPFNLAGVSDEVRAMFAYLLAARTATGVDVVVTCTTDHPRLSASGNVSRHRQAGTAGEGLAIDCRLRTRGLDIHRPVFNLFVPVEAQLHELIYAKAPYNIKAGKRVAPYAVASHHDHVHVSVDRGRFLRWPGSVPIPAPAPPPAPPQQEDDDMAFIAYIENGPAYLIDGNTKVLIDASEIERLKAIHKVVLAPKLIERTPDAS